MEGEKNNWRLTPEERIDLERRCPWCGLLSPSPEKLGRHWIRCKKRLPYPSLLHYGGRDTFRLTRETNYVYGREYDRGNLATPRRGKKRGGAEKLVFTFLPFYREDEIAGWKKEVEEEEEEETAYAEIGEGIQKEEVETEERSGEEMHTQEDVRKVGEETEKREGVLEDDEMNNQEEAKNGEEWEIYEEREEKKTEMGEHAIKGREREEERTEEEAESVKEDIRKEDTIDIKFEEIDDVRAILQPTQGKH